MTTCRPHEPCGQDLCGAVAEMQALLPKGRIWRIDGDRVFGRLCYAIAAAKSELMGVICQVWREIDPCTAVNNLDRWAAINCFPVDCVELTQAKMCEWVALLNECPPGSEAFLSGLVTFAEIDGVTLDFDDGDCTGATCCGASIIVQAEFAKMQERGCDCTDDLMFQMQHDCSELYIPEIECLRDRYFPAGVRVKYETTDCDPDFIRTIQS